MADDTDSIISEGERNIVPITPGIQVLGGTTYLAKRSSLENDHGKVVREKLFRKMKFADDSKLFHDGNAYRFIADQLGYDLKSTSDETDFKNVWDEWMKRRTKRVIAEKRSTCQQNIERSVAAGKFAS